MFESIHARTTPAGVAAALLLAGLGVAAPLHGQSYGYAEVTGVVRDSAGFPLAGAFVTLRDSTGALLQERRTGREGEYRFAYLEPGVYQLRVEDPAHRPVVVPGLDLDRGTRVSLPVELAALGGPAQPRTTTAVWPSRIPGSSGRSTLPPDLLHRLPFRSRDAADIPASYGRHASRSVEGLPIRFLQWQLGGMGGTGLLQVPDRASLGLPVDALGEASWRALPDVEFDAPAGIALDLALRRPTDSGGWADVRAARPGLLESEQDAEATDILVHGAYGGSWDRGGGLIGGIGFRREAGPAWATAALRDRAAAAVGIASDLGVPMKAEALTPEGDEISAFARLDAPVGREGHLRAQALLQDRSVSDPDAWLGAGPTSGDGRLALLHLDLSAPLGSRTIAESRLGLSYSEGSSEAWGHSRIGSLALGSTPPADERFVFFAAQALQHELGSHRLKVGASANVLRIEAEVETIPGPAFRFADPGALAAGRGLFAGSPGGGSVTEAVLPRFALFAQDVWQASPRLRLLAGARMIIDGLPVADIDLEERWYFATGMANTALDRWQISVEPRLGVEYTGGRAGGVRVYASGGLFHDRVDPRAVVELIGNDGDLTIRRLAGDIPSWPSAPAAPPASRASGLTLAGSRFEPPRTLRVQAGVVARHGTGDIGVDLVGRRTDRLLARRDGNRPRTPWGSDQYGRVLWAPPVAVDGLLASADERTAVPDFDHVWVLDAAGESTYYGATVFGTAAPVAGVELRASYTFSQTRDSWPATAGAGSALPPGLGDAEADAAWIDGVSDYDIPHRGLAEALVTLPVATRPVAAVRYRLESGHPFTPGYYGPLDYNVDGTPGDPALIDTDVPGMATLVSEWECLREHDGNVAPRNSCRLDVHHAVDISLHLPLARERATLVLEALDLLGTETGPVDAGLYRLDPSGALAVSGSDVAIPLVVNPEFGSVLLDRSPATVRLGLRVTF